MDTEKNKYHEVKRLAEDRETSRKDKPQHSYFLTENGT